MTTITATASDRQALTLRTLAPEHLTATVTALREQVAAGHVDLMPILADALQDAGCEDAEFLAGLRDLTCQITEPGERMVVVGRDGASHDRHGNGIYTTKVYEAVRRQRDGRLTWRLAYAVRSHRTAGKKVTGPMERRAEEYAAELGLPVATHITHGTVCL